MTLVEATDQDFTWKDPKAAEKAGMPMMDYVIRGVIEAAIHAFGTSWRSFQRPPSRTSWPFLPYRGAQAQSPSGIGITLEPNWRHGSELQAEALSYASRGGAGWAVAWHNQRVPR
jgi:hypothetical protein